LEAVFAVLPVYFFILLGFIAKKIFTNQIDEKTLVINFLIFFPAYTYILGINKISDQL
jgi:4-hydroxybenzoate polyprenyltransferase